jgi:TPR repeat protein
MNYKLGLMYLYGYGTKLDYKEALKCFRNSTKLCNNDKARFFSEILYKDMPASFTEEYLKKVAMFEAATEQLDLEDKYELGLIYYHGVNSISEENSTNETEVIISPDHKKSLMYFRMVVNGQLLGNIGQK